MTGILRTWPAWKVFTAGGTVVCAGYFVLPWEPTPTVVNVGLNVAAAVALAVGPTLNRAPARWPWSLMSASMAAYAAGMAYYGVQAAHAGHDVFPSPADYLLLTGAFCVVAALAGFVYVRRAGMDRPGLIDALILSTGAGMLSWVFLMSPYIHASGLDALGRGVLLAYPVAALFSLGLLLRMAIGRGDRPVPYLLLVAAMTAGLVSDATYSLLMLTGDYRLGDPIDIGWLAMRVLLGAAALHPAIAAICVPTASRSTGVVGTWRFTALTVASLTAPAALTIPWLRAQPLDVPVLAGGAVVLFVLVIARLRGVVTVLSRTLRAVEEQANTDQLTGLANRRSFHDRWQRELDRGAVRSALLYVDLDGFKPVNDALGHTAGDTVLTAVADRLRTMVRADDMVARLGGDEFAVILGDTDDESAHLVAQRIVEALADPFPCQNLPITIGASVGVVVGRRGDDPEVLLRRADAAMYAAKAAGRGRVHAVAAITSTA
jgi:diguanylate cyclase (GGDEF)-like protein